MKTGAMVLGLIGGILAFLLGLLGFTLGQVGTAVGARGSGLMQLMSLSLPIIGIVGGAIVKSKALAGGALMLVSAAAIIAWIGFNFFALLPGIPLIIGGILGVAGSKEAA